MGQIITLTGRYGVGKTTVAKEMLYIERAAQMLTSRTTRPPRNSDIPGEYEHLTRREFHAKAVGNHFAWIADLAGEERYGTTNVDLLNAIGKEDRVSIMILVPETLKILIRFLEGRDALHAASFFYLTVHAPEETLRERMMVRGDKKRDISRRMRLSANWDERAMESQIPYIFADNTGDPKETARGILRDARGSLSRETRTL